MMTVHDNAQTVSTVRRIQDQRAWSVAVAFGIEDEVSFSRLFHKSIYRFFPFAHLGDGRLSDSDAVPPMLSAVSLPIPRAWPSRSKIVWEVPPAVWKQQKVG